ncbi:peptidyl-tRNA hydrolase [Spizellomyces punctatus DAOM BR117]|uniref:Peptidyl-tRNA hydrolase n=1 Tax=Spizellomyces punctatus (strain DAOM BR117) TaxID=645134 RepID=A0A0L0H5U3_SPIPD|nr:peptidyl-tRNA hydrolase [Spizellomyces punctatus DAOM BR117]KNC96291.1 peptidyl-tRNA hydrolase [Spizellomyces punctatus DAOM BR117]|eukprot:XP_016604331.1 peptidyl-tRNA hydrolase [Spizellomyces punctatus DAOM BR117]
MTVKSVQRLVIVGLGNHTHPYTRHNVGMMALDFSVKKLLGPQAWKPSKPLNAIISETILNATAVPGVPEGWSTHVVFVKPRTYMNFNGSVVLKAVREYGVRPKDVIIVHDDLERKLGAISAKKGGSANGHNGVKSVIASLKTDQFPRIRIGIDRPISKSHSDVAAFVLTKFSDEDTDLLKAEGFPAYHRVLLQMIKGHANAQGEPESAPEASIDAASS